jgi:hypothetical protein
MGQDTSKAFLDSLTDKCSPKLVYCLDGHRCHNVPREVIDLSHCGSTLTLTYAQDQHGNGDDLVDVWGQAKSNTCLHPFVLHVCPPVTVVDFGQSVRQSIWEPTIWDPSGLPGGIIIWIIPMSYIYGWGIRVAPGCADMLGKHRSLIERVYVQMTSSDSHGSKVSLDPHYEEFFRSLTLPAQSQDLVDYPE